MPPKLRHACERCGLEVVLERAGRFRDEDFYELLHEYFALERQLADVTGRYLAACERIEQLRELVNMLPDPVPEVEAQDEESECPF